VLFADLVGFSTLAEHLDPEELRTLMTDTFAELTEQVEAREGWVEKFIGDAIVAVFGAPVTHEDDPQRAVEAALAMLEVVRRRSERAGSPLELRVGVNSGLVVAGAVGDGTQTGVMGDAVNTAARLQQAAGPGEVLIAASTWRRVRHAYAADPAGSLEVKGKSQPVEAYRVLGRGDTLRPQLPFVGRGEELALLELLWSSALKGNTHVVSIVGEPGVGKSRLLEEFRPEAELDLRVVGAGGRAFGPFLDLVELLLGGVPADVDDLKARAAALGVDEEDALLLSAFLGFGGAPPVVRMADEQQKRQVFAGVWQFLLSACRERPAFVALDDVHWVDESSRDLLDFLLERLGGVPLVLVLSYRPGFEAVERAELRASHTVVRLEPLTPEESVALARGFLGVSELPADLEALVARRAEGNPFFIEELLQALLELGSLAVVDGRAVLARIEVEIPDTVQGTILARVDRLEPRARAVLQHAAVLGRSFSTELLEEVSGEPDLAGPLATLARAQLIVASSPGEWAFKHALIQEVTYETLLLRQRRELHRRVAEALETRAGDDPLLLGALAEHYTQAEAPEQARRYAVLAGDLAQERMGFMEAKRRYERALALWGEGDEMGRLELLGKLARTGLLTGDPAIARTALIEAEAGLRARGELLRAGEALALLGRAHWVAGDGDRAAKALDRAIAELEDLGPTPELVEAYIQASTLHMLKGTIDDGAEIARRGLVLAAELSLTSARSHLLNTLGCCEVFVGDVGGVDRIKEALAVGHEAGDATALGRAYINLSSVLPELGLAEEAVAVAKEGRETMRRLGAPGYEWFIAANEAHALVYLGRLEEAATLTAQVLEQEAVLGTGPGLVNPGMNRIHVLTQQGEFEAARALADRVLPIARRIGGAEYLAQALGLEAELEAARGNLAAARQAAREAADIALATPSAAEWIRVLPVAARLLPPEGTLEILERLQDYPSYAFVDARRAEAEGLAHGDPDRSRAAAELFRELRMPYDEARCRIEAGEHARAQDLIERLGVAEGPLARALVLAS
jgi:class 3 adenylate cyclase/tetratricopeptide (TPR) repeat protein